MLRKKLKELQKDNSAIISRDSSNVNNKIQTIKSLNPNINYKKIEKITRSNLPELRLSKIKSRIESEISASNKNLNQSNNNSNSKNFIDVQNSKKLFINKKKNNSLSKKNEIVFPKISNSIKSNNMYKQYEKYSDSNNSFECNGSFSNEYRNYNTINNSHIFLNKIQNR